MKPYACYPGARARFQPMHSIVRSPYDSNVPFTAGKETRPSANIVRNEGSYEIQLAVPGFAKDQIKIEVIEDQLIITATNPNQEDPKTKFIRQEFEAVSFKRVFRLHRNANSSALNASFDQGILIVTIPDKEPETIKIDIQ
ncbi:MAG: Hsp20/alpha crystallin family protein [Saprospiraceae bacterium]